MKAETASELRGMDRPQFLSHPVHVLFENQVSRTPHAVALQTVDQTLSYEALDLRAMRLAARVAAAGCEPGSGVGLLVDRSVDMVTAMLAAMKTGTFFVPLDRTLPDQRLRTMVEKTNARIILAQPHYIERAATIVAPGTEILPLSEAEDNGSVKSVHRTVSPDAPVYVMFTSGSTGTPKGVMVPHKSVASRLLWMAEAGLMQPDDRVLQRTPFAFDASIWEIFAPLVVGARLCLIGPGDHRDPARHVAAIRNWSITVMQAVPSFLSLLLDQTGFEGCTSLRRVFFGGEPAPAALLERARRVEAEFYNLYGPTETCIDVTCWRCGRVPDLQHCQSAARTRT